MTERITYSEPQTLTTYDVVTPHRMLIDWTNGRVTGHVRADGATLHVTEAELDALDAEGAVMQAIDALASALLDVAQSNGTVEPGGTRE
ncbi:MAG: hypothetical protein ACOCUS_00770 [Polyangiales bacterium]